MIHFVVRPTWTSEPLEPLIVNMILAVSLSASLLGLLILRARVPRKSGAITIVGLIVVNPSHFERA